MRYAAAVLLLLVAGCASSADNDPNAPNVTIHLVPESSDQDYTFSGPVNVRFQMFVANTTNDPVTFTRIEIRTVSSGAFTIRPTSTLVNLKLAPGESKTMPIAVWGYAPGGRLAATEPVTLRGTAFLSGPKGAFMRLFSEYLTER